MGLDMNLYKKTYVKNWSHMKPEELHEVIVTKNGKPTVIKPERIAYIVEEVADWRKVNAIHKWFVDNVQEGNDDCKEYYVDDSDLVKLLDICKSVIDEPKRADELLPTEEGFFFGSTEYDTGYFDDIKETIKILEGLVKEMEESNDANYYYRSSW